MHTHFGMCLTDGEEALLNHVSYTDKTTFYLFGKVKGHLSNMGK